MADLHRIKSGPSRVDLEMVSLTIKEVSGSLGLLAMMATRVDDNEMVIVYASDFYGMMETLRGQLARAQQRLQTTA